MMKDKLGFVRSSTIQLPILTATVLFLSTAAFSQVGATITTAPPPLPLYDQPACTSSDICPLDGYVLTPGYWAWDGDYYWVPGTRVYAPEIGDLWTPGYWSWSDGGYVFHEGYWGKSVGFYGGINYRFGYPGHGYEGAVWENGRLYYNTSVNSVSKWLKGAYYNIAVNSENGWLEQKKEIPAMKHANAKNEGWTYNIPVKDNGSRVSYDGGKGGIVASATAEEEAAARDKRSGLSLQQLQNAWFAHNDPYQHFAANHGAPAIAATPLPQLAVHPGQLPPVGRFVINTGNAELDQKFHAEQDQLVAKLEQERKKLQLQQDIDRNGIDQERTQQKYDPWEMEHVRPDHGRQTQDLYQGESLQMHELQQRQQAAAGQSK